MATVSQINANRENALHSTGPRTVEGKSRSAANATRHGLTGNFSVLPSESQSDFDELLAGYQAEFHPQGHHQNHLVSEMAQARWRMARVDRLEAQAFNDCLDDAALLTAITSDRSGAFASLRRYRASAEKTYHKAHRELLAAQQSHTPAPEPPPDPYAELNRELDQIEFEQMIDDRILDIILPREPESNEEADEDSEETSNSPSPDLDTIKPR